MARHFVEISQELLRAKIAAEAQKSLYWQDETIDDLYNQVLLLEGRVEKDLSKVIFDQENCDTEPLGILSGMDSLLGFHTLENGLTYLGVRAGGDWEEPLFYIIYWDGKKLRAYIPKDGNTWNQQTKTAYGSEEEADDQYDGEEPDWDNLPKADPELLINDIQARIKLK